MVAYLQDTIVARATSPGAGALAVVRLSGPGAFDILDRLTAGASQRPPARRATLVRLRDPDGGQVLDQALATVFPGPASFTGEDVVEFSCHGGVVVVGSVEMACRRLGARGAEPGEFTRRAFLNGRIDLLQAEAIADLVEGRNPAQHAHAIHHLERGLSQRVASVREQLLRVEALLVQNLDFPEEDEPPVPVEEIRLAADGVLRALDALLATAPQGTLLREGGLVVLAGRPNAGKSSLFNALLGEERAIVTEEAGTTRDALEVPVSIAGYPFRLVDTAGLREGGGKVERLGIEVARRYLEQADLVMFCMEAGREPGLDELAFLAEWEGRPGVVVRTKRDLAGDRVTGVGEGIPGGWPAVEVSVAGEGGGLALLSRVLGERVYGEVAAARYREAPVVTRARQAAALGRARDEVRAFATALSEGLPPEVASTHLRPAETALEELVGVIQREDVLDVLFREFCIGK